jgi:hypothetical protein
LWRRFSSTISVTKKEGFAGDDIIQDHIENKLLSPGFSATVLVTKKESFADDDIIEDDIENKQYHQNSLQLF